MLFPWSTMRSDVVIAELRPYIHASESLCHVFPLSSKVQFATPKRRINGKPSASERFVPSAAASCFRTSIRRGHNTHWESQLKLHCVPAHVSSASQQALRAERGRESNKRSDGPGSRARELDTLRLGGRETDREKRSRVLAHIYPWTRSAQTHIASVDLYIEHRDREEYHVDVLFARPCVDFTARYTP